MHDHTTRAVIVAATLACAGGATSVAFAAPAPLIVRAPYNVDTDIPLKLGSGSECVLSLAPLGKSSGAIFESADPSGVVTFHVRPLPKGQASLKISPVCTSAGQTTIVPIVLEASGKYAQPQPEPKGPPPIPVATTRIGGLSAGPAQFDVVSATDAELAKNGYPPRPRDQRDYALWLSAVTTPQVLAAPRSGPVDHYNPSSTTSNWSGFALDTPGADFAEVAGFYYVPRVTTSRFFDIDFSSLWVGLDGFGGSPDVVQDGTEQDCTAVFGWVITNYVAWYEFFPDYERSTFSVSAGDRIYATSWVATSNGVPIGYFYLFDFNRHQYSINSEAMPSSDARYPHFTANSAEWILERTMVAGRLWNLPNYGHASMDTTSAFNAATGRYEESSEVSADRMTMVDGSLPLSTVGPLSADSMQFTWLNY